MIFPEQNPKFDKFLIDIFQQCSEMLKVFDSGSKKRILVLNVVSVFLPVESGEKISLGITILLAQTVNLLILSNILPASSKFFPILGKPTFSQKLFENRVSDSGLSAPASEYGSERVFSTSGHMLSQNPNQLAWSLSEKLDLLKNDVLLLKKL